MSELPYAIDFSSQILYLWLYMVKEGDRKKNLPVIDAPVHDEYDGASYNSVWHSICKLCPFL